MSFDAYHVIVELLGYHWTLDIKVGLGISQTNADSQWNLVYRCEPRGRDSGRDTWRARRIQMD